MSVAGGLPGSVRDPDLGALVAPERLASFFAPRSIALVGASDTSQWTINIVSSLRALGFDGRLVPVHPRHATVLGMPAVASLRDLDDPVDLAFALVPTRAVGEVLDDAAAAGVRGLAVLASGFADAGDEGAAAQRALVERAAAAGITVLGPNGLGFVNAAAGVAPYGLPILRVPSAGPVGVVLQSGALAGAVLRFADAHAIGLSLLVSMGNEAMVTTADVIDHLIEDGATRVVALFLESIRQPERFAALARKALDAGKPIVAVKVGRSPGGRRAALAHTGAVAGDDIVVDAVLRQLGVVRVGSLEELLVTAGFLGHLRVPSGRRLGVVTPSGGACEIIADRAAEEGVEVPAFTPETERALAAVLPPIAAPTNPVDVTGYGLAHTGTSAATPLDAALSVACRDPGIDAVLFLGLALPDAPPAVPELAALLERRTADVAAIIRDSPVPVLPVSNACTDLGPYAREVLGRHGLHVLGGIEFGTRALGHALRWARVRELGAAASAEPEPVPAVAVPAAGGPWSELAARELLAAAGVPMVPAVLAATPDEAVEAAERLGLPVALKVCSAQITHKSDVGGVALGLTSPGEVRAAHEAVVRAATAAVPAARVDGVLVSPMRTGGVELLAGVTADPTFGPVLALGLGGVWVEAFADTAIRMLPVTEAEVRRMLGELRGAALLRGARGRPPADLDAVAAAVVRLAGCAGALGRHLSAVEVNPLWVDGSRVEALDALVVTGALH